MVGMSRNRASRERQYDEQMGQIARDWAVHIVGKFKSQIDQKKISLTKELLESFQYTVQENGEGYVTVNISYTAHGKYLDMKNLYYHKMPPVDELEAWVLKRGIENFQYIPGYSSGWLPSSGSNSDARRIAWGIASSIKASGVVNQYGKWGRSKQWRAPELKKGITYLNHLLAEELAKTVSNNLVTAFTQ